MEGNWWAKGLLFENCSCQLVCPGHIHFEQLCTHETCCGYWAFRFDDGEAGGATLKGLRSVIAFESPKRMVDGGWTQIMFVDDEASTEQRSALEAVFRGEDGGPWEILARFVSKRIPTRYVPIKMTSSESEHELRIDGVVESNVKMIRGEDRAAPVTFDNIFNQIHSPTQVLAFGNSKYDDGRIRFDNERTHGLWSQFEWTVTRD